MAHYTKDILTELLGWSPFCYMLRINLIHHIIANQGKKYMVAFWLVFYLFILSLLLNNSFSYLDPDFGWHLKVGEAISVNKTVPRDNIYNYSFTGQWVDHEWLSNLIIYKFYNNVGYPSVNLLFAFLVIIPLIIMNIAVHRFATEKISDFWLAAWQVFGVLAARPHFGVRVQEVAFFSLSILIFIIELSRRQSDYYLFLSVPLLYFWSCLHASFLIGLLTLFLWALFCSVMVFPSALNNRFLLKRRAKVAWMVALFSLVITALTPYGLKLFQFLVGYGNRLYMSVIGEWTSPISRWPDYKQLVFLALVVLIIITGLILKKRKRIDIWPLILMCPFLALAIASRRHFPLFFVASFYPIAMFSFYVKERKNKISSRAILWTLRLSFLSYLILLTICYSATSNRVKDPFSFFSLDYPYLAVKYLHSHPEYLSSGNFFNDYSWGGYLIWALPEKKLFIDGRLPQVSYVGGTFLGAYLRLLNDEARVEENFNQYGIGFVMLPSNDRPRSASFSSLRAHLASNQHWLTVYSDPVATVYLKKQSF